MELVETWNRARTGEPSALDQVCVTVRNLALRSANSLKLRWDECEDLAQEVTASILRQLPTLPTPRNLGAFIWSRTRSKSRAVRRQRTRSRIIPEEARNLVPDERAETPWRQLERDEQRRALRSCIDQLPYEQSVCVRRRYEKGDSLRAIARDSGVSHVTIQRRLASAMATLSACLVAKGIRL